MARKSRREIERDVEQMSGNEELERPVIMCLTTEPDDDLERALATKPHPNHSDRETVAVPKRLPRRFWTESGFLTVVSHGSWDKFLFEEPNGEDTFFAVDLWEGLTDAELNAELAYREENEAQVPTYLREKANEP